MPQIESQAQIVPIGIQTLNQLDTFGTGPVFDLLLAYCRGLLICCGFVVDQSIERVTSGERVAVRAIFVLLDTFRQITGVYNVCALLLTMYTYQSTM